MRAVLFDVDGVLLDSYAGYREVWSRWCVLRDVDLELAWAATHGTSPGRDRRGGCPTPDAG